MPEVRATTVPVSAVLPRQRARMWEIFDRYYEGAERSRFEADLSAKDHVILLHDGPTLCGFSTVTTDRVQVDGRTVISVFSGDTVLEAEYHGQTALQWAFFQYIAKTKLRHPHRTVVWFLISKGYKTYLLLSRNFVTFYPRRDQPEPVWATTLIRELATRRFGAALDPEALVLRFPADHERLRAGVAPAEGETHPDIRFFVARNPGHAAGDELCCIGVVDAKLILAYPLKLLRRTG